PGFHPAASSPFMGRIIRLVSALDDELPKARNFPDGCQDPGIWSDVESLVSRWTSPTPSARCQYRLDGPSRFDRNAIRRPSGVQTGAWLSEASTVRRVNVSRASSYT